jgi:amino acid adenylation domain-containing protein
VKPFSCYIVGSTTLPIKCAEILLRAEHEIFGVISRDEVVTAWAGKRGLRVIAPDARMAGILAERPFDYLFSIVSDYILTDTILNLPRKFPVNYHDAPLPRYAGTHATSWALIHRESSHGVSWHVASERVDAGDILKQRHFAIDPGETAFSLNTRCYEAAIVAFDELVRDLAADRVVPLPQDLSQRSFFPCFKRPAAAALIDWDQPAEAIAALVQATDFGPHPNPLGVAKVSLGLQSAVVNQARVLPVRSGDPPGTVVSASGFELIVATVSNDIALTKLSSTDGTPLVLEDLAGRFGVSAGGILPTATSDIREAIDSFAGSLAEHEAFWVKALSQPDPVSIPYANTAGPSESSLRFEQVTVEVPAPAGAEALIAAWTAYLFRLSGATSFDLGFVCGSHLDAGDLFARTVPLKCELDDRDTFKAFASRFETQLAEVRKRKTFLRDVVLRYPALRQIGPDLGRYSVAAEIASTPGAPAGLPDAPLTLVISPDGDRATLVYHTAIYSAAHVASMAGQFQTFLASIRETPDRPLCRQPIMEPAEVHRIVTDWNATSGDFASPLCLHELFEAQVARTPSAEALVWLDQRLTYDELNRRANQVAHHLRAAGVGPDVLVGLCLERSIELLVGLLGILKAGGAYVPLDPTYPVDRLLTILDDAGAKVIVTAEHLRGLFGDRLEGRRLICLDADAERISLASTQNPGPIAMPRNLAYVIYTSGSTGRPKGVAIEHHSPVTLVTWGHSVIAPEESASMAAVTSICFDLSVWEIFLPLARGGRVVLALNALHLIDLPAREEITLVNTVPSAIREIVRRNALPASVQVVCLAGEALSVELVKEIYGIPSVRKVYDLYGPSETTTYSSWVLRRPGGHYTVGRPIGNTQIYVLDRNDEPVPPGVTGQIHIGGDGVAREYLGRPDLTAERFVPDRFSGRPGARLYRTGDLGRFYPNGDIELLGRMDHQVKIRGFRIELGEIESVLRECPGVASCVVVVREDVPGEKRLVAYVAASGESADTERLRFQLKQKLPDYMVPSAIVRMDALPLNPSGKIDRKALPAPDPTGLEHTAEFVAPRDEVEEKLAAIWREVLRLPRVGVNDDYFALGGDSLAAVTVFARIEDVLAVKLGLATLLKAPTVAQLASLIRDKGQAAAWSLLVAIQPKGTKPPLFCIHARGGNVLFYRDLANRLGPDQPFYGIQPQGLDGKQPYLARVEDMAALYIREMKKVQPAGPYYVGGSSFGGTAAFEIAQQLTAAGDEVALLAVFDTGGPGYPRTLAASGLSRQKLRVQGLGRRVSGQLWNLWTLDRGQRLAYVRAKMKKAGVKYRRKTRQRLMRLAKRLPASVSRRLLPSYVNARWALLEFQNSIAQALNSYTHRVYPGRMVLFRATKQPIGIVPDPTLGWGPFVAGGLEIHDVAGGHGEIVVEPSVRFLASQLSACIDEARCRAGTRELVEIARRAG